MNLITFSRHQKQHFRHLHTHKQTQSKVKNKHSFSFIPNNANVRNSWRTLYNPCITYVLHQKFRARILGTFQLVVDVFENNANDLYNCQDKWTERQSSQMVPTQYTVTWPVYLIPIGQLDDIIKTKCNSTIRSNSALKQSETIPHNQTTLWNVETEM